MILFGFYLRYFLIVLLKSQILSLVPSQFWLMPKKNSINKFVNYFVMTFNGIELAAVVRMAMVVAASDGNVAETEKAAIAIELIKFGVNKNQLSDILKAASSLEAKDSLSLISGMTQNQKKYVAAFLAVIIAADGKILESEVRVWAVISSLCKLPNMTIREGIDFWKNN